MRIEEVQPVKATQQQVYDAWTDYPAWPNFSTLFTRVDVLERRGNAVLLDIDMNVMGRTTRRTERHVVTPPKEVRVEGETETATNTSVWSFEPTSEGTLLRAVVEGEQTGLRRLLGPFAKRVLTKMLRDEMRAFATYVEAKK
jgi:ribosome-associated toxin RatA of RatAB toxin-antitoxin module